MKRSLVGSSVGAALLLTASFALAQTTIEITPEEERTFYTTVTKEKIAKAPPAGLSISVGAEIPRDVELYEVPASVQVASVKRYRYTVVNDRVVLVDPTSRKVVRVISK